MGPRRFRRGNDAISGVHCLVVQLQWGRDVSVAEICESCTLHAAMRLASMGPRRFRRGNLIGVAAAYVDGRLLQWGRDVSVAEITY